MRRNSGLIGEIKEIDQTSASGKHDIFDQYNEKLENNWPISPKATITPTSNTIQRTTAFSLSVSTEGVSNGTLYWTTTDGNGNYDGARDGGVSGSFTITNGSGSFNMSTAALNAATIGEVTFKLEVRTSGTTGTVIGTSELLTISASTVEQSVSNTNEGSTITIGVTTSGLPTLTFNSLLTNTTGFNLQSTNPSASINGSGNITTALYNNWNTTGNITATSTLRYLTTNLSTATFDLIDTSTSPTINANTTSVSESGGSVTFTASIPNSTGTNFSWYMEGAQSADFSGGATSGTVTSSSDSISITRTLVDDAIVESESFRIRVTNIYGTTIGYSPYVTVTDTSPVVTNFQYSTPISEGFSYNCIPTISNGSGKTFTWSILHGTTTSADFSSTSATFTGGDTFNITTVADELTEGTQTFQIRISYLGTVIYTSGTITINDTSVAPTITSINVSPSSLNEGSSISVSLNGTELSGKTISWSLSGTGAGDITEGTSGTMSGTGSLTLSAAADQTTEGAETFTIAFSYNSQTLYTSSAITINDTSLTPGPTVTGYGIYNILGSSFASIDEDENEYRIELSGTNLDTYDLDWSIDFESSGMTTADFLSINGNQSPTETGTMTYDTFNNRMAWYFSLVSDSTTDPGESFRVTFSYGGNSLLTTDSIPINDTSTGGGGGGGGGCTSADGVQIAIFSDGYTALDVAFVDSGARDTFFNSVSADEAFTFTGDFREYDANFNFITNAYGTGSGTLDSNPLQWSTGDFDFYYAFLTVAPGSVNFTSTGPYENFGSGATFEYCAGGGGGGGGTFDEMNYNFGTFAFFFFYDSQGDAQTRAEATASFLTNASGAIITDGYNTAYSSSDLITAYIPVGQYVAYQDSFMPSGSGYYIQVEFLSVTDYNAGTNGFGAGTIIENPNP